MKEFNQSVKKKRHSSFPEIIFTTRRTECDRLFQETNVAYLKKVVSRSSRREGGGGSQSLGRSAFSSFNFFLPHEPVDEEDEEERREGSQTDRVTDSLLLLILDLETTSLSC